MNPVSCGPLPNQFYQDWLRPPLEEGLDHLCLAYKIEGFSLVSRVTHLVEGAILMVPLVNLIVLQFLQIMGWTTTQDFERAVRSGDETSVKNYLKLGLNPNRSTLLFHAKDPGVIRALLEGGADSTKANHSGTRFLEHLVHTNQVDLATELVNEESVDIRPYLTSEVFQQGRTHKGYRTFLLHMGYDAMPEERKGLDYYSKTALTLEKWIMEGNIERLKAHPIADIERDLPEIQAALPRLKTDWIWTHVLQGCCDRVDFDPVISLLRKGAKVDPLTKMFGDGLLLEALFINEQEALGREIAENSLVSMDPYFTDNFLKKALPNELVWLLIEMGCPKRMGANGYVPKLSDNQLEILIFTGRRGDLKKYAQRVGMQQFYEDFLEVKQRFPKVDTNWVWGEVFWVPPGHYALYGDIQKQGVLSGPSPIGVNYRDLKGLLNRVNFTDPDQSGYISEAKRTDTYEGTQNVRKKTDLAEAIDSIIKVIDGDMHYYPVPIETRRNYQLHIEWIVHYLQKDLSPGEYLSGEKASALVDMLKECVVCPSRWSKSFDIAYHRISGKEVRVETFEDRVQLPLGQLRVRLLDKLTGMKGRDPERLDTHLRDNAIYHLQEPRAIPVPPVHQLYSVGDDGLFDPAGAVYRDTFVTEDKTLEEFDALYTPGEMMEAILEHSRGNPDFRELFLDNLTEMGMSWDLEDLRIHEIRREKNPVAKAELKALKIHVPETEADPVPFSEVERLLDREKKEAFQELIIPLNEDYTFKLKDSQIHPLILAQLLVKLGHFIPHS